MQSALDAAGPAAARIGALWWVMLGIATAVFIVVMATLIYAVSHRRPRHEGTQILAHDQAGVRWVIIGGAAIPAVILVGVFIYTMRTLHAVGPASGDPDLVVEVTGRQWWWEVRYSPSDPAATFATANEIRIPVGRRVQVRLRSEDVIHSFWVPRLQGKMDLVPGLERVTWIQADEQGTFRGQCAEYCGLQHTRMALYVVALDDAAFEQWRAEQLAPAAPPEDALGRAGAQVFLDRGCVLCHTIRGTPAAARAGPDLTHVGSRLSLAAGTLPNTQGHLAGWIANPQSLKPGNHMPAVPLEPDELHAIVHYLRGLR